MRAKEATLDEARPVNRWTLARLSVAAGLSAGLGEAGLAAYHKYAMLRITRVSSDVAWMAPLADAALFLAACTILYGIGHRWPALRRPHVILGLLGGLTTLVILLTFRKIHPLAIGFLASGLGAIIARGARRWPPELAAFSRVWLLAVAILAGGAFLLARALPKVAESRALAGLPPAASDARNVLLIILDTVRAESLGLYGRDRPTSPALDELAASSVVFDRAIAPSPWTLPSHAAMFTGQRPDRLSTTFHAPLDGAFPTLAQELASRGYRTGGFTANLIYTSYVHGLSRGFHRYEDYPVSFGQMVLSTSWGRLLAGNSGLRRLLGHHQLLNRKSADQVVDRFLGWLEPGSTRPFFAFLNLYEAHEPYLPPPPFDRRFGPRGDRGKLRHTASLEFGIEAKRPEKWRMSRRDREIDLALYEGAIAYLDHVLSTLLRELRTRGLLDETLLVVSSDHGEQFGEHGLYGHTNSVYMPLLHVPLLVRLPGRVPEGLRVGGSVSLRQLPATILELAASSAEHPFPGPSLAGTWRAPTPPAGPVAAYSELVPALVERDWYPSARGTLRSVVRGRYHYIRGEDGGEELYDLDEDPGETRNLAGEPTLSDSLAALRVTLDESLRAERTTTGGQP